jgi:murein DD-endopeptidase MepM/ murein hydrolase activator NlpD
MTSQFRPVLTARPRAIRRAAGRLGAYGALGAVLIGACAPAATNCAPAPAPVATTTTTAPAAPAVNVPLEARPVQPPCTYIDTWGAARDAGRVHEGTDIMAAEGNQLYAVASGTITKVYDAATDVRIGNGLILTKADKTYFFYGHLSALAPGLAVGATVTAGQLVGYVGHTGNTTVSHLHLEIHPGGGAAINPYPILQLYGAC